MMDCCNKSLTNYILAQKLLPSCKGLKCTWICGPHRKKMCPQLFAFTGNDKMHYYDFK